MGKLHMRRIDERNQKLYSNIKNYYHYTSLSTAWAILENDCLRATHARFSNDSEELKNGMAIMKKIIEERYKNDAKKKPLVNFMGNLTSSKIDCYIICFCGNDDKLSQWRGYCRQDGVSFGFAFADSVHFYLKDSPQQVDVTSNLHSVYYISKNFSPDDENEYNELSKMIGDELENKDYSSDHSDMEEILLSLIPLIKDPGFREEDEYRLTVMNNLNMVSGRTETPLDSLIQYQEGKGVQRPYLNIRFGKYYDEKIDKEIRTSDDEPVLRLYGLPDELEKAIKGGFPNAIITVQKAKLDPYILVGEASDAKQEEVLRRLENIKTDCSRSIKDEDKKRIISSSVSIWFEGHLPIRSITVSPCADQEEVVESFRHYCAHKKFWLKYVKVKGSSIPFRRPK